jgi:hypothetical protein
LLSFLHQGFNSPHNHLAERILTLIVSQHCSVNSPDYGPLPPNSPGWCLAPFDPEGILRSDNCSAFSCSYLWITTDYCSIIITLIKPSTPFKCFTVQKNGDKSVNMSAYHWLFFCHFFNNVDLFCLTTFLTIGNHNE